MQWKNDENTLVNVHVNVNAMKNDENTFVNAHGNVNAMKKRWKYIGKCTWQCKCNEKTMKIHW